MLIAHLEKGSFQGVFDIPMLPFQASQALWAIYGSVVYDGPQCFMEVLPYLGYKCVPVVRCRAVRDPKSADPVGQKRLTTGFGSGLGEGLGVHKTGCPIQYGK